MSSAIPFGDPRRLIGVKPVGTSFLPTRQDPAIVICGGGDPFEEAGRAVQLCQDNGFPNPVIFAGNDMIGQYRNVDHACSLHPNKKPLWLRDRTAHGYEPILHWWAHRPSADWNHWTGDWGGSTGMFCTKLARELGHTHVILCGVHMSPESNHFIRKRSWDDCCQFQHSWTMRWPMLRPYVRSYGGWTKEHLDSPTATWLTTPLEDTHRQYAPPNRYMEGLSA